MGIFIQKKVIIITKLSQRSSLYLLFTLDTCWNNGGGCQLAKQKNFACQIRHFNAYRNNFIP